MTATQCNTQGAYKKDALIKVGQ